jgi:hypothetical protein
MSMTGLYGAALRARFVLGGAADALVDGSRVACESLSVRAMNFGQHWRGVDVPLHRYSVELPMAFFVSFLADPERLADLNQDAKLHPDPSDSLDQALSAAGFPSAQDAVRNPALAQSLAEFFAHDALVAWLGDNGPDMLPGFVLNSCDRIVFRASGILVEGECRPSASSRAYQDL